MARPERNTVDYFPHLIGDGKKIFSIEAKYGNDGYATWFKILERLASTDYHFLNLNDDVEVMYLAGKCHVTEQTLFAIITDLTRLNVFNKDLWESKIIWSQNFIDSIQDAYFRRNSKCFQLHDLCKHLLSLGIQLSSKCSKKSNINTQTILKEIKEEEIGDSFVEQSMRETYEKWLSYKKGRKETYKDVSSKQAFYNKLVRLSDSDPKIASLIVEESMANGWSGIFELKNKPTSTKTSQLEISGIKDNPWR